VVAVGSGQANSTLALLNFVPAGDHIASASTLIRRHIHVRLYVHRSGYFSGLRA
jgi:O-acetylhomoserine/O-acetylserine sulfhydrylase-like pyridoxal-dependent enzyme